jgi:ELWxxDGT repeat protein
MRAGADRSRVQLDIHARGGTVDLNQGARRSFAWLVSITLPLLFLACEGEDEGSGRTGIHPAGDASADHDSSDAAADAPGENDASTGDGDVPDAADAADADAGDDDANEGAPQEGGGDADGSDPDGGPDGPPADACIDDDGDGVCNEVDRCPGLDDGVDVDGDGAPDCAVALLSDLNQGTESSGGVAFVELLGAVYFAAVDALHGQELWRTDGTAQGTSLAAELTAGPYGSDIIELHAGQTQLFIVTGDGKNHEIWRSDGTQSGTRLIAGPAVWLNFAVQGDRLYFIRDGVFDELWTSDGTIAGTVKVTETETIDFFHPIAPALGLAFFAAGDDFATEPWRTDGTAAGTFSLAQPTPTTFDVFRGSFAEFNGLAYFNVVGATFDVWVTDGTVAGTRLLSADMGGDLTPVATSTHLFTIREAYPERELWAGDGTDGGFVLLRSLADFSWFGATGSELFFVAVDDVGDSSLWKSDGTPAGTILLVPGFQYSHVAAAQGTAFWEFDSVLWKYGASGPVQLTSPDVHVLGNVFNAIGNRVFFEGETPVHGGEPWVSDGTPAGTREILDLNTATSSSDPGPFNGALGSDRVLFAATTAFSGRELYESHGSASTTELAFESLPGADGFLSGWATAGGYHFFRFYDDAFQLRLHRISGTGAPEAVPTGVTPFNSPAFVAGDQLFFIASDGVHGFELFVVDLADLTGPSPTLANGHLVLDINPTGSAQARELVHYDGILYFFAEDVAGNSELWRSDGTAGGTSQVIDLLASGGATTQSKLLSALGSLYFTVKVDSQTNELYKSDGTAAGTTRVSDFGADNGTASLDVAAELGGYLYFRGVTITTGTEIWRTNGSQAELFSDLAAGRDSSGPFAMAAHGGALYFTATSSSTGVELWKSDGTAAGTVMLKDIFPGGEGSYAKTFFSHGAFLYFSADDGVHGRELWHTDGTAAGTVLDTDINPGAFHSTPDSFLASGSTVYFAATDLLHGREPWSFTR